MHIYLTAALYFLLAATALGLIELGHRLGMWRVRRGAHEATDTVGASLGGILALLAFMLAFTFSLTSSRFAKRKSLVIQDANVISTTYLRTDFLAEEDGAHVRALLYKYAQALTDPDLLSAPSAVKIQALAERADAAGTKLWQFAADAEERAPSRYLYGLFMTSLNEMLDTGTERRTVVLVFGVPGLVWWMLGGISVLAFLGLGYQAGLLGRYRSIPNAALAIAIAAVYCLSVDLDRVDFGFTRISQQPMVDVREMISRDLDRRASVEPGSRAQRLARRARKPPKP